MTPLVCPRPAGRWTASAASECISLYRCGVDDFAFSALSAARSASANFPLPDRRRGNLFAAGRDGAIIYVVGCRSEYVVPEALLEFPAAAPVTRIPRVSGAHIAGEISPGRGGREV